MEVPTVRDWVICSRSFRFAVGIDGLGTPIDVALKGYFKISVTTMRARHEGRSVGSMPVDANHATERGRVSAPNLRVG